MATITKALDVNPWEGYTHRNLYEQVKDRALGKNLYNYYPYHCFIEFKPKDPITGIEYRDCIIDYTRCKNINCIKKLV